MGFRDPAEAPTVAVCAWCRREIYVGDEAARIDNAGGFVHAGWGERCAREYAFERVYNHIGIIDVDLTIN